MINNGYLFKTDKKPFSCDIISTQRKGGEAGHVEKWEKRKRESHHFEKILLEKEKEEK